MIFNVKSNPGIKLSIHGEKEGGKYEPSLLSADVGEAGIAIRAECAGDLEDHLRSLLGVIRLSNALDLTDIDIIETIRFWDDDAVSASLMAEALHSWNPMEGADTVTAEAFFIDSTQGERSESCSSPDSVQQIKDRTCTSDEPCRQECHDEA